MISRKKLGWSATSRHDFDLEVYTTFWPPFYSTNFFLPCIEIKIKNNGSKLNEATIEVDIRRYDGDISSVTTVNDRWGDAGGEGRMVIRDWEPGSKRSFIAKIPSYRLPSAGTYIIRVRIMKWVPLGTPYEELLKELKKANLDEGTRRKLLEMSIRQKEEHGIDPHRLQPGSSKSENIFDGRIVEYFRVEEFSNVLNFWLIVATLILATATLLPYADQKIKDLYKPVSHVEVSATTHHPKTTRH